MSNQSLNHTTNFTDVCVPHPIFSTLWYNFIPGIEILINIFVISAAFHNRRRLRHNYVYVYVINTLVANALFGLTFLYTITNSTLFMERIWNSMYPYNLAFDDDDSRVMLRNWFAFRSTFMTSLFLVMSGSISALIYGIRESSYFVGRRLTHRSSEKTLKLRTSPHRRTKMIVIILLNWLIPLLLNIASAAGWNCAQYCICVPGYYGPDLFYCQTDKHRECSRILQPQKNSLLILSVVIWSIESCGMVYMLVTMVRKYLKTTKTRKATPRTVLAPPANTDSHELKELSRQLKLIKSNANESPDDDVFKKSSCFHFPNLSYHVKLLLVISITFITLTLPTMILIIVDTVSEDYVLGYLLVLLPTLLCLIYCSLAPIVLVYYMPGLRLALRRMFFNCTCCTKTTLTSSASVSSGTDI